MNTILEMTLIVEQITMEGAGVPSEARAAWEERLVKCLFPAEDESAGYLCAEVAESCLSERRSGEVRPISEGEAVSNLRSKHVE